MQSVKVKHIHITCRRCGRRSFHKKSKHCSFCNFLRSSKLKCKRSKK